MSESDLITLKLERTQLRRTVTKACSEYDNYYNKNDDQDYKEKLDIIFIKVADKVERLWEIDRKVREILFIVITDEQLLNKEADEMETYRDKWLEINSKHNKLTRDSFQPSNRSCISSDHDMNFGKHRLPKLELTIFDGEIKNWIKFWASFRKVHENKDLDLEEKFQYLSLCMAKNTPAKELIDSFPPSAENYSQALDQLKRRFGRDSLLVQFYVRQLLNLVLSQTNSCIKLSLRQLYDKLETQLRCLETLGVTTDKYACMLAPLVESALPEDILRGWDRYRIVQKIDVESGLEELLNFLRGEVESEERIILAKTVIKDSESIKDLNKDNNIKKTRDPTKKIPTATDFVNVKANTHINKCIFCDKNHESVNCFKAQEFNVETIKRILKDKGCCMLCLKRGHRQHQCRSFVKCFICKGKHNYLLCAEKKCKTSDNSSDKIIKTEQALSSIHKYHQVYLKTVKVILRNENQEFETRLFFDEGSQRSYITKRMATLLNYKPLEGETLIHGLFGGVHSKPEKHTAYRIRVGSVVNDYSCNFKALDKEIICDPLPVAKRGPWEEELKKLNINLSDEEGIPVEILVGADIAGKLFTGKRKELKCGLIALETRFGWTLTGKINEEYDNPIENVSLSCVDISAADLWRLDIIGIEDPVQYKSRQQCEEETMKLFKETVQVLEDGRYEVRLPWLQEHPLLPQNFVMAEKRLNNTYKKLQLSGLVVEYEKVFREWLSEGIIEEVNKENIQMGYYLPHRPVLKEASTTKIRPVFDASARLKGEPSLNQCVEKGPNLIELLPRILTRFRLGKLAIISDIRKAFLQISIHPVDRKFLHFLWRDEVGNLKVFRHARLVFGISCSPFLLAATLEHLLDRTESLCEKTVVPLAEWVLPKLRKGFYVDNCVVSVSNEEELQQFIKEATLIFAKAKFDLKGWEYSHMIHDGPSESSVLGIIWNKKNDTLRIKIPKFEDFDSIPMTRRILLSAMQKIFDPVGLVAPAMIIPKLLIQKTWKRRKRKNLIKLMKKT